MYPFQKDSDVSWPKSEAQRRQEAALLEAKTKAASDAQAAQIAATVAATVAAELKKDAS